MPRSLDALHAALALIIAWQAVGGLGLLRPHSLRWTSRVLFPSGAAIGAAMCAVALIGLWAPAGTAVLPIGLPDLPMHLRLDALSAFFLLLLGAVAVGIGLFSAGYFRSGEGTAPGLLCLQYHTFLASMAAVLLADDAYTFMLAWEVMALASYFLVTTQHRLAEIRRAGFIYLLIAHVGALGILLCFGVLHGPAWQFTFQAMRGSHLDPGWATAAFSLALFGFGAKAGLVPLHVWLPEAHPAAPSPVSALMSAAMLKIAVYGLLRVVFDLLHTPIWGWGAVTLALGLFTALFGAVYAAVQTDMKRLLAYSSIENLGVVFAGVGLAMVFAGVRLPALAALALAAALYHALNHAFFKSLLFLATGSVLHATHERSLGKLGGLLSRMPWVGWLALVGTLAIAGLPPLNGFVSEWLLLQAFLAAPALPLAFANMVVPLGAALLVLTAALAGYVMVKFYGIVFLGRMRETQLAHARDCGGFERFGLGWLALGCVALGLAPVAVLRAIDRVVTPLLGASLENHGGGWLRLVPLSAGGAAYSPAIFLLGIALAVVFSFLSIRAFYHGRVRRAPPWDCGYPLQTPRMQDSAEGFGQPIRHLFAPLFHLNRELPGAFDTAPRYRVVVEDRLWLMLYLPLAAAVQKTTALVGRVQQGRIGIYLLYSFATLLVLLVVAL